MARDRSHGSHRHGDGMQARKRDEPFPTRWPLLSLARIVHIAVVDARSGDPHGEEPGADVATFLARTEWIAIVERLESGSSSVAETLCRFAGQAKADLMVFGAYSHVERRDEDDLRRGHPFDVEGRFAPPLLIAR